MSQSRSITDFFNTSTSSSRNESQTSPSPADTSFHSPRIPPPPSQPGSSLGQGGGIRNGANDKDRQDSIPASQAGSFNSSQRVIKNGKVVITSSDGDDTDSVTSMDDPDDLLRMFTSSASPVMKQDGKEHTLSPARPLNHSSKTRTTKNKKLSSSTAAPSYKFSLETLVTDAVDDNEVEADIAKFKQALESSENAANSGDKGQKGGLREEMLASAIDLDENDSSFQRLLDAVNRTDAFGHDLSWSFFEDYAHDQAPSPESFPNGVGSDAPAVMFLKGEYIVFTISIPSVLSFSCLFY